VNLPGTNLEIKIVLTIRFRGSGLKAGFRCLGVLLCNSLQRLKYDGQAACDKKSPNVFEVHHVSANLPVLDGLCDNNQDRPQGLKSRCVSAGS
jgi:hypothetical protein